MRRRRPEDCGTLLRGAEQRRQGCPQDLGSRKLDLVCGSRRLRAVALARGGWLLQEPERVFAIAACLGGLGCAGGIGRSTLFLLWREELRKIVVECRAEESFDGFGWAPVIRMVESPAAAVGGDVTSEWSAAAGFSGPPGKPRKSLSPWEKYAQVLLLTNEFMFVD